MCAVGPPPQIAHFGVGTYGKWGGGGDVGYPQIAQVSPPPPSPPQDSMFLRGNVERAGGACRTSRGVHKGHIVHHYGRDALGDFQGLLGD